jgi:hypothetical protein
VHDFFRDNVEQFDRIATQAESLGDKASGQLTKAAKQIRAAQADPTKLCDDRECAKIGDPLIAIDCDRVPNLGANNDAEWLPISKAIGKILVNPYR